MRLLLRASLLIALASSVARATDQFPPTRIYQKDGVWRVDYLSGSSLDVYREGNVNCAFYLTLENAIPPEEFEKCVAQTTAGPEWSSFSIHYFPVLERKPHFCVRTWWGRRILINLRDLKHVRDAPYDSILRAEEQRWIIETLTRGTQQMPPGKDADERREIQRILTAVYQAGRMQLTAAIPLLRQLESFDHVGGGGGIMANRGLRAGEIHPLQFEAYTLRRMAQTSLRGLGEKPREDLPATRLHHLAPARDSNGDSLEWGPPYELKKYSTSRHDRARQLRPGMSPVEVLDVLGPPDEVVAHAERWRYDVDADIPYSLLLKWKDYQSLTQIMGVRPPLWWRVQDRDEHAKPFGWKSDRNPD